MAFLCLKTKAVAAFSDVKKINKWKKGKHSISLLKTVLPWRSTEAIDNHRNISSVPTQETSHIVIGGGGVGQRLHVRNPYSSLEGSSTRDLFSSLDLCRFLLLSRVHKTFPAVHQCCSVSTLRTLGKLRLNIEPPGIDWFWRTMS